MTDAIGPTPLSPADELVRGWLDAGLRDAEIAVRLGVPTGEARARVARVRAAIASADAAALPGVAAEPVNGTVAEATARPNRSALAFAGVGTLAIAGVAAFVLAFLGDSQGARLDDGQPDAAPVITAAASTTEPTPSPTPALPIVDGVEFQELRLGGPALLPEMTAMLVESNCERCPWATGLYRLRTVGGQPIIETLFLAPAGTTMDSVYAAKDGSTIVVATGGSDRTRSFQRSEDGGVTWQSAGEVNGDIAFLEAVGPAHLRVRVVDRGVESIVQLPEGLNARETALDPALVPWAVFFGIEKFEPPPMGPYRYTSWAAIEGGNAAVTISPPFGPANMGALAIFNAAGKLVSGYANTPYPVVGMVSPNLVAANVELPPRQFVGPALINIATGQVHALRGPVNSSLATLRIRAVQTGPFALAHDTGIPCVPVMDAWNSDSASQVACAAAGVLLRSTGTNGRRSSGEEWMLVQTPSGVRGWVRNENIRLLGER